jgi:hypothetical protein
MYFFSTPTPKTLPIGRNFRLTPGQEKPGAPKGPLSLSARREELAGYVMP